MSKIIFLDRDGVINEFPGEGRYVTNLREFRLFTGSVEGIRKFNDKNFKVFIISNQAGVSKDLYTAKDLKLMDKSFMNSLNNHGASIEGIFYCTHNSQDNCECRKPKIGLLKQAVSLLGSKPEMSFFIGDSFIDMQTARNFGAKSVLVLSGREKISNRDNWEFKPDYIFDNLLLAANYICFHYG